MRYTFPTCGLIFIALLPASAQVASHQPTKLGTAAPSPVLAPAVSGRPVARVNGTVLTDADLLQEMYTIFPYAKQHNGGFPKEMEPQIRSGALQMIIFEELVYQAAQQRNLPLAPERLSKAERDLRQQFGSASEYQQFLQAEFHGSKKALDEKIRRSLLIEQFLKTEVESKSRISAVELKAFYDKNPARFQYAESFAIQTISVIPPANATAAQLKEARKRAEDAFTQAKATKTAEEFGLLAEKLSDDDYRVMLGDHKWVERTAMPPEMLQPALQMQAGQMSDLIQVGANYVIFRMNRHVPAGRIPFEKVKDQLRKELEKTKASQLQAALGKRLRRNAKVETL